MMARLILESITGNGRLRRVFEKKEHHPLERHKKHKTHLQTSLLVAVVRLTILVVLSLNQHEILAFDSTRYGGPP